MTPPPPQKQCPTYCSMENVASSGHDLLHDLLTPGLCAGTLVTIAFTMYKTGDKLSKLNAIFRWFLVGRDRTVV